MFSVIFWQKMITLSGLYCIRNIKILNFCKRRHVKLVAPLLVQCGQQWPFKPLYIGKLMDFTDIFGLKPL